MASFMNRLESEIERRDAAVARIKQTVREISTEVNDKYTETKTALAPSNIVENLKTEYSPQKLVVAYPWASVLAAMAAGFVIVPLFKKAASAIPSQPTPPPQRVVIELKGAGPIHTTSAHEHDLSPKHSIKDIIADGAALMGTLGTLLGHFNAGAQEAHHNGNGNAAVDSSRI